jgi:hypothetical protein
MKKHTANDSRGIGSLLDTCYDDFYTIVRGCVHFGGEGNTRERSSDTDANASLERGED